MSEENVAEVSFDLPSAAPIAVSVVRALSLDDVPKIMARAAVVVAPPLRSLRQSHHQLARFLASGMGEPQASSMTGYSLGYIRQLKDSPAFAELLAYYCANRDEVFVDLMERMRIGGLSVLDELQRRLEEEPPENWTKRELMEYAELLLGKGGLAGRQQAMQAAGQQGSGSAVTVNVQFVRPGDGAKQIDGSAVVIDGSAG